MGCWLFCCSFNIKSSLAKEEVIRILKRETIPYKGRRPSIFVKVSDFTFWEGRFDNEKFSCMPLPQRVPPYGGGINSLLPIIKGEILGKRETEIKISINGTLSYLVFLLGINICLLLSFFIRPLNWKGILIVISIDIFIVMYFRIVAAKVKVLFEELLGQNAE